MYSEIEEKRNGKIYHVHFDGLVDLYDYLKSDPEVNSRIFYRQASLNRDDPSFYGESLDKSIEYLLGGYEIGLDKFLETNKELTHNMLDISDEMIHRRGIYGGMPLSPLVAAGVPDCMIKYERNQNVKIANIYFGLGYPCGTGTDRIINRGLATIYLIQALEAKGYIVNFYAYELSEHDDEIVNIEIKLKTASDLCFNVDRCYFPMRGKEFLRRILFRVLESVPVETNWSYGYGRPCNRNEVKNFYSLDANSLIVGTPGEMGIEGENIYTDTKRLIKKLKLDDEFDLAKLDYYAKRNR